MSNQYPIIATALLEEADRILADEATSQQVSA